MIPIFREIIRVTKIGFLGLSFAIWPPFLSGDEVFRTDADCVEYFFITFVEDFTSLSDFFFRRPFCSTCFKCFDFCLLDMSLDEIEIADKSRTFSSVKLKEGRVDKRKIVMLHMFENVNLEQWKCREVCISNILGDWGLQSFSSSFDSSKSKRSRIGRFLFFSKAFSILSFPSFSASVVNPYASIFNSFSRVTAISYESRMSVGQ